MTGFLLIVQFKVFLFSGLISDLFRNICPLLSGSSYSALLSHIESEQSFFDLRYWNLAATLNFKLFVQTILLYELSLATEYTQIGTFQLR